VSKELLLLDPQRTFCSVWQENCMGPFGWLNHAKRIRELEDTVTKLWSLVEKKDMDWADLRARCKRLLDRDEKSVRRLNQEAVVSSEEVDTPNGEATSTTIGGRLTEHQRQIQQQILRRRAGM
jgi:hypothetical protein